MDSTIQDMYFNFSKQPSEIIFAQIIFVLSVIYILYAASKSSKKKQNIKLIYVVIACMIISIGYIVYSAIYIKTEPFQNISTMTTKSIMLEDTVSSFKQMANLIGTNGITPITDSIPLTGSTDIKYKKVITLPDAFIINQIVLDTVLDKSGYGGTGTGIKKIRLAIKNTKQNNVQYVSFTDLIQKQVLDPDSLNYISKTTQPLSESANRLYINNPKNIYGNELIGDEITIYGEIPISSSIGFNIYGFLEKEKYKPFNFDKATPIDITAGTQQVPGKINIIADPSELKGFGSTTNPVPPYVIYSMKLKLDTTATATTKPTNTKPTTTKPTTTKPTTTTTTTKPATETTTTTAADVVKPADTTTTTAADVVVPADTTTTTAADVVPAETTTTTTADVVKPAETTTTTAPNIEAFQQTGISGNTTKAMLFRVIFKNNYTNDTITYPGPIDGKFIYVGPETIIKFTSTLLASQVSFVFDNDPALANKIVVSDVYGYSSTVDDINRFRLEYSITDIRGSINPDDVCPSIDRFVENQLNSEVIIDAIDYQNKINNEKAKLLSNKDNLLTLLEQQSDIDKLSQVVKKINNVQKRRSDQTNALNALQLQRQMNEYSSLKEVLDDRIKLRKNNTQDVDINVNTVKYVEGFRGNTERIASNITPIQGFDKFKPEDDMRL